ncbi:substrate-binding domain-containing protein [Streptomyces sp. Y7]|uniref:substrate-binding domain-containing protein n=1 Tax=Streptomyces sp. Y7 TaxID=3342392 RepID=UPI00371A9193
MNRRSRPSKTRRTAALVAAAAATVLLAAGCSSSSGGKKAEDSGGAAAAGKADTPRIKVALITHAGPGQAFWDTVRKGAEVAAAKDNIQLLYSSDPNAGNQANLVQNAIDQKVAGIAVTLAKPDALKGVIVKAKAAGIPVVGLNSGTDTWKSLGLLEFFGQNESVAGESFGEKLNALGAKHTLCVVHEQGNVGLQARCDGIKKTFKGKTDVIYVNGTDMPSVKSTITAKLQQDHSIDEVATLYGAIGLTAVESAKDAGSKAKVATFDLDKQVVAAIKDGQLQFAVDQQPYLQGYLAIDSLWLYKNNGNYMGGGQEPVLTGPAFVDKSNIAAVEEYAAKGTR